ncbi:uncharacterized protein FOMMEDRAFT_87894 [Fomitiporia mediterranea MF3/22]|uniref:uncharacterized protein n=1 Tax=Fomitiporia mediterranea (strain MF3/22) TaxID=694068 RepID=UPI0004408EDB|nr:uncharacterized protein FOMMEDRAFT_87894 [Fomitiporia mediterranea MF3/22]EJD02151.1 hypothetical protein FOMMEDRAFT_87894 [Fomitiporia mediterranea MF3/22]
MLSVAETQADLQHLPDSPVSRNFITCRTCCTACSNERRGTRLVQGSSLTLSDHFLCAGTLVFRLISGAPPCMHQHADDGFHAVQNTHFLAPYVDPQDHKLLVALSFLLQHRFAMITYLPTPSNKGIILRIYLIPYDLPGTKGALRVRDEDKVMKPARTCLRIVLSRVSKRRSLWSGESEYYDLPSEEECFLLPIILQIYTVVRKNYRSLQQIFNDLTTTPVDNGIPDLPKLRTSLYEYQKESVAKMLEMEAQNRIADDPLYIPITGTNDSVFYFQPTTMELLLQCPRSFQARGGILCEELGTGKTVMILALILATLNVLSEPPEHSDMMTMTPLALRHFPGRSYDELRKLAMETRKQQRPDQNDRQKSTPSLVEIVGHYARANLSPVHFHAIEDTPLWSHIRKNTPFFLEVDRDNSRKSSARQKKTRPPRLFYLTNATLIVVPVALQMQWYSEILKHCSSSVRTLVAKSRKDIPPPLTLASDYDIVLTTYNRCFEAAVIKDPSVLHSGYTCNCPEFSSVRVPDCTCPVPENVSSLLQVRWKRIVRDEGHNAASRSTELNWFLRMLSAERKWIVTGTPTTNLLGLNFGSNGDDESGNESSDREETPSALPLIYSLNDAMPEEGVSGGAEDELLDGMEESQDPVRVWSKTDRVDLRKLGSVLSDFLGVLPFAVQAESFSNLVVNGLMGTDGPLPGTPRVLEQVMAANMVRHRVSDIERFVRLPPLKEEVVMLDLEEYGQMTYNVLLSFVAVNAVDSERRDMDYLFHSSKTSVLASTIENLSHSLFWRFDENALDYDLSENIHRAENAIIHARERGQSEEDIHLVERAIAHLSVMWNNFYSYMQHGLEVPYRIYNASLRIKQTWGLVHDPPYALDESVPFLAFPSYALELRDSVLRQPLINEDSLVTRAELVRARNRALAAFVEARKSRADKRSDAKSSSEKRRRREEAEVDRAILVKARQTSTVDSKEKLEELHEEFRKAQERLKAEAMDEEDFEEDGPSSLLDSSPSRKSETNGLLTGCEKLLRGSPFVQLRVGNSTSSKLNYIFEEVRKYSATEKFLIFSSQPFNLVHISEGLDLMGIKYLHFMQEASKSKGRGSQRDQLLTTFETSERYRVFLMELKYGARGLNIVSASRVIFCEPVWHADVESQAIKRVHRIGQTRPVTVKTLAIRSTFEEYMANRRRNLKGAGSKGPGMAEENGVCSYLKNPIFLEMPSQNTANLDFPLVQVPDRDASGQADETKAVETTGEEQAALGQMGNGSVVFGGGMDVDQDEEVVVRSPKCRKVHFG